MSRIPLFKHTSLGPIAPPAFRSRMTKKLIAETAAQSNEIPSPNGTSELTTVTVTLSPSYLAQTATPSRRLQDPSSSRKLLVLDLNGTLLLRPKRGKGKGGRDKAGDLRTRIRPIHPRPYIPTFREYLSHAKTMSWLDTMVWSSAQPPGVKSMVEKCFYPTPEGSRCLKGLWARDMFGLEPEAYGKKTLTTKDLNLIWSKHSFSSSPSLADMLPQSKHPFSHSSETTILLDDSPRKARLQPWNHICIKEYGVGMRRADLDVWMSVQSINTSGKKGKKVDVKGPAAGQEVVSADIDSTVSEIVPPKPEGKYDETLLAIIGVLETLKHESNAAAWIRGGGLLTGQIGNDSSVGTGTSDSSMWFDDMDNARGWASKGKDAIHKLGIELIDGFHG
ncbi:hypothetical protein L218DRAFT_966242 [Marasmius fiardii PR-910]|nr:hypothetical protein L218DRAFT_966242 [Marasmius fiardii PR-910]